MWGRERSNTFLPLLVAALLPLVGCAPKAQYQSETYVTYVTDSAGPRRLAANGEDVPTGALPPGPDPRASDRRGASPTSPVPASDVRAGANQPAAPAAVQTDVQAGVNQPAAAPAAQPVATTSGSPPPTGARAMPAELHAAVAPLPAPPSSPPQSTDVPAGSGAAPSAGAGDRATPLAPPQPATATEQRLAAAQKRIAKLERELAQELSRRKEVEAEMARLLAETSAGPYERSEDAVEQHLRRELERARTEIRQLRATVTRERRERDELERRFTALQAQAESAARIPAAAGVPSEEVEALKERQRRVLASIQQDLAASRQREAELQASLAQAQGDGAVSLTTEVSDLRSENSALQLRLDQEHQRNRELAAKLTLATRVTNLIYRMQNGAVQGVAAVPLPAE